MDCIQELTQPVLAPKMENFVEPSCSDCVRHQVHRNENDDGIGHPYPLEWTFWHVSTQEHCRATWDCHQSNQDEEKVQVPIESSGHETACVRQSFRLLSPRDQTEVRQPVFL